MANSKLEDVKNTFGKALASAILCSLVESSCMWIIDLAICLVEVDLQHHFVPFNNPAPEVLNFFFNSSSIIRG